MTSNEFKIRFDKGLRRLMLMWEENPAAVIGIDSVAMASLAKTVEAVSGIQSKRAYAKHMDRRPPEYDRQRKR